MIGSKHISRKLSRSAVMQAVIKEGPISRASVAKQTGLSKQVVSEIVHILQDEGWVQETGRTKGHIGRTAVTYEIVPDAAYVYSVDLGGTKLRAAIVDLNCRVVAESVEPTNSFGGASIITQIGRLCAAAARKAGVVKDSVRFAVIGVPGVHDPADGSVQMAPNIPGIDTIDFHSSVSVELGCDVVLENDVNLAALGEQWAGSGIDCDNLAFIAMGTGIGAGLILNGQLIRGAAGAAGELGYMTFGEDSFNPESLRVGAFEREAGSIALKTRYMALSGKSLGVPEIFNKANEGDENAKQVLRDTARLVARGIATLAAITDPDIVVLGGSIGHRSELLMEIQTALALCFPRPLRIETSKLGKHAALIGGAALGLSHLHHTLFADGLAGVDISLPELRAPDWEGAA